MSSGGVTAWARFRSTVGGDQALSQEDRRLYGGGGGKSRVGLVERVLAVHAVHLLGLLSAHVRNQRRTCTAPDVSETTFYNELPGECPKDSAELESSLSGRERVMHRACHTKKSVGA